jgi:ABC-type sugar transport system ATPase subunit
MSSLIRLTGITKRYSGARGLDGVDFDMPRGEARAHVSETGR